jgi:hypothetical protein
MPSQIPPDIIDRKRSEYSEAVVTDCCDMGCTVRVDNLTDHIIFRGEDIREYRAPRASAQIKMADRIIIIKKAKLLLCIVELKSSINHKDDIIEQIENAYKMAIDILLENDVKISEIIPYAFVTSIKWRSISEKKAFQIQIWTRGKPVDIVCLEHNDRLTDKL